MGRTPIRSQVYRAHDPGWLKANAGWYEQAVAEYQRAIELDPANASTTIRASVMPTAAGAAEQNTFPGSWSAIQV